MAIIKKRKKQKPTSLYFAACLPEDITIDILCRLQVKILLRFRSVCKSWLYLISNPNFIKTHLHKSSLSDNFIHQRLLLSHVVYHTAPSPSYVLRSLSLHNIIHDYKKTLVLDYPKRDSLRPVSIIGSCNGLVCIAIDEVRVFLWNPCTRISNELTVSDKLSLCSFWGFAYDQLNDDYKLVWMDKKEVKVFSLKSNSWKKIGDFPKPGYIGDRTGTYVNSVLHWAISQEVGIDRPMVIVSLDLGNENYEEMQPPYYDQYNINVNFHMILGILEGCFSVFYHSGKPKGKRFLDIWVMKEYGVSGTWIKLYSIPHMISVQNNYCFYSALCIYKTGEILLDYKRFYVIYNPNERNFRILDIGRLSGIAGTLKTVTYVESLVSPSH